MPRFVRFDAASFGMAMRIWHVVALAMLAGSCAAAGGTHGDPCALLTSDEVATALQQPAVDAPTNTSSGDDRSCLWTGTNNGLYFLTVTLYKSSVFTSLHNNGDQEVPNIGQSAYWDPVNGLTASVDGETLNVVAFGGQATSQTSETDLARLAASRL